MTERDGEGRTASQELISQHANLQRDLAHTDGPAGLIALIGEREADRRARSFQER